MLNSLLNLVLGPPGKLRLRVQLVMLAMATYVIFAFLKFWVMEGMVAHRDAVWLTTYTLGGSLSFYVMIRSGWTERYFTESSLLFLTMFHGVLAIVWFYAVVGPARGAVLAILVLMMAFGMFGLSARQSRLMALLSFVALGLAMVWKSQTEPDRYPVRSELIHFFFSMIVLSGVAILAQRMATLRGYLRAQRAALAESLERNRVLATQDELTGLVNRRHMGELIATEHSRIQRSGSTMCLVLLDIDYFKQVNDSYGHQAGDLVLKTFSQSVVSRLRGADVLARWGGEEFLLLLPDTGAEEGLKCVERMRAGLTQVSFDTVAPGKGITFSAGLARCEPGEAATTAIERADAAMYRAKQSGRNCTVLGV